MQRLPKVNKSLAAKLMDNDSSSHKVCSLHLLISNISLLYQNAASSSNVLRDERFASLFTDPKFQVDEESEVSHAHSHIAPPIIAMFDPTGVQVAPSISE